MQNVWSRRLWRIRAPFALILASLVLFACGAADTPPADEVEPEAASDADEVSEAVDEEDGFPVSVGGVDIPSRPERIVSLSATATEMLFAIGAGDQVTAADEYSTFPAEAPTTDLSGFQPNVEAISAFDPDLVIVTMDPGELIVSLETLGIPTILLPTAVTIEESYDQIEQLGVATGNVGGAAEVVAQMQSDIDEILASIERPDEPYTYYHELTPDFYSVSGATFIGDVYRRLGLTSIADEVGEAGGPYPQLSPEFIIESDPDIILLADAACCDVTPEEVSERPGWDTISAVQDGAIVVLDEDIASRWGPRIVDLMRDVADAIRALEPAA